MSDHDITDADALRAHYGAVSALARDKAIPRLDQHCRAFIAASPFLVIGSAAGDGRADVSPKGDAPGFVQVLDDATLAIPDRPGNRRVDSMQNILENPEVALIFFVPGMNETLRVNGRARVSTDPDLLAPMAVNGKAPLSAIVVDVEEAFLHCAKALVRAQLWDPARHVERKSFPTLGQMIADQIAGVDAEDAEARVQDSIRNNLY
jgi:PPOX class probable FMN-dependent enzyme